MGGRSRDDARPATRAWSAAQLVVVALAALATLVGSVGAVLAPVVVEEPTYTWEAAVDGPSVALPLVTGRPLSLDVTVPCAALAGSPGRVLSTVPPDDEEYPDSGLVVSADPGPDGAPVVSLALFRLTVLSAAVPDCTSLGIALDADGARISADGEQLAAVPGDRRPDFSGLFTGPAVTGADLTAQVRADDRFASHPSTVKVAAVLLAVLGLVVLLLALRRADGPPVRPRGRRWPRPRDGVVGLVLAGWALVGPATVDDGYIAAILRDRSAAGFVGNYFRWYDAPEAPFGWFYELLAVWSRVSPSMVWLRIPSVLLGVATWLVVDRVLRPRLLGATGGSRAVTVAALVGFLLWWLPYNSGVRPEPWIALGAALSFALLLRTVDERRAGPAVLAAVAAMLALAAGPTGLLALAPFLTLAPGLLRVLGGWTWPQRLVAVLAVAAGAGVVLVVMFADQSLATVLEATDIRTRITEPIPFYDEGSRYLRLLQPGWVEGSFARRLPLLLTAAAAVVVGAAAWQGRGAAASTRSAGTGPRLGLAVATAVVGLLALAPTPTKWTHHFGAGAPYGAIVIAAVAVVLLRPTGASTGRHAAAGGSGRSGRPVVAGTALLVAAAVSVSLLGWNQWWYLSGLDALFANRPVGLAGVPAAAVVAVVGVVAAVALLVRTPGPRVLTTTFSVVLVGVLALEVGSYAVGLVRTTDTYSTAGAGLDTVVGDPCLLERSTLVETDPGQGLLLPDGAGLSSRGPDEPPPETAASGTDATVGGGAEAPPASGSPTDTTADPDGAPDASTATPVVTDWFDLPTRVVDGTVPLVVPTSGRSSTGVALTVETRPGPDAEVTRLGTAVAGPQAGGDGAAGQTEVRVDVARRAPGATQARLSLADADPTPGRWVATGVPRAPMTTSLSELNPTGSATLVDFRSAFFLPCSRPADLTAGAPERADYLVTSEGGIAAAAGLAFDAGLGGPYAGVRRTSDLVPLPTYLDGRGESDYVEVWRVDPRYPRLARPPEVAEVPTSGTARQPPVIVD